MESRHDGSARVCRFILLAALLALGALPASAQPQPMPAPGARRNLGPSPYDGYAVPAEILAGKAAEWLVTEATAATALPPEQRHAKRVDRILSAAVAARAVGKDTGPAWGSTAYGEGTPATKAFAGFSELLDGKADQVMALAAALASENLQGGWRDLALGLRQAAGTNEGKLINPQAVLALYLLGMPYPGGSKEKDNSAIAALRFFGGAPAESQKAVAEAVLKGKAEPACQDYLTRQLPGFLESMFRNFQSQPPSAELGRLMVELTDDPRSKANRAAMLPKSMGAAGNQIQNEALKQAVKSTESPGRRLGIAQNLLRGGEFKAAYDALLQLETDLPEEMRPLAWAGQYRALAEAAKKGTAVGTTVAAEKAKRSRAVADTPGPLTQAALADLEYYAGDKAAGLTAYATLVAAPDTPAYLCMPLWNRLAEDDPAKAWALLKPVEAALMQPIPKGGNTSEGHLLLVGQAMGQMAATADVLARVRPQRTTTWQVGNEAALRCLAGQTDQAAAVLGTLDSMEPGGTELNQFLGMAVAPRAPVTASEGPLRKAAAEALAKCPPTPGAWALGAGCAVRLMQTKNSANGAAGLWGDLMRRLPAELKPDEQQLAAELSRGFVESTKANRTKDPGQFVNLLDVANGPLRSRDGATCFPYALELLVGGLREGKAVAMTEPHAEGGIKRFVAGLQECKAPADAYAKLKQAVTEIYPSLAGAVTVPAN